ncbi:MAG TPA: hypothetical protein VHX44_19000 [Planctomycetota bacterium]|nr:hypothetical protein [Planctomycetota bacterium]
MLRSLALVSALALSLAPTLRAEDLPPIKRVIPDQGKELPGPDRQRLSGGVGDLQKLVELQAAKSPYVADIQVFLKALDFALRYNKFYDEKNITKDVAKADWALNQAKERLEKLDTHPWTTQKGLVIRGFTSAIDGTVQPYGLVIPEGLDLSKPAPLYVWLHGRQSKEPDLQFLYGRSKNQGEVHPDDTIVLHAFGRQCIGFKGPGEIDVLEAIAHAETQYKIDHERIVLMGFSMGGGGSKSLGCHYTDHFCCIHTGAGYSETARFCRLKPENYPPPYEQTLWTVNDVPNYVRNLFNIPFSCYSGEKDGQIQAAQVLEESFKEHGKTLIHLIGPDTAHKYHPETLKQALALVKEAVVKGRPVDQPTLSFQTRTLQYNKLFWVEALGLDEHWKDTRIDAEAKGSAVDLKTVNLNRLRVSWPALVKGGGTVTVDGTAVKLAKVPATGAELVKDGGTWRAAKDGDDEGLRKRPGLQGPIDDCFNSAFLVVEPTGTSFNAKFDRWSKAEAAHFHERWSIVICGDLRVKKDTEVTDDDFKKYHVLLWSDAVSNKLMAKVLPKLPIS